MLTKHNATRMHHIQNTNASPFHDGLTTKLPPHFIASSARSSPQARRSSLGTGCRTSLGNASTKELRETFLNAAAWCSPIQLGGCIKPEPCFFDFGGIAQGSAIGSTCMRVLRTPQRSMALPPASSPPCWRAAYRPASLFDRFACSHASTTTIVARHIPPLALAEAVNGGHRVCCQLPVQLESGTRGRIPGGAENLTLSSAFLKIGPLYEDLSLVLIEFQPQKAALQRQYGIMAYVLRQPPDGIGLEWAGFRQLRCAIISTRLLDLAVPCDSCKFRPRNRRMPAH